MRITRATPDDLGTLVAFRDQAAAWLAKASTGGESPGRPRT